jgi:hypothetical protein
VKNKRRCYKSVKAFFTRKVIAWHSCPIERRNICSVVPWVYIPSMPKHYLCRSLFVLIPRIIWPCHYIEVRRMEACPKNVLHSNNVRSIPYWFDWLDYTVPRNAYFLLSQTCAGCLRCYLKDTGCRCDCSLTTIQLVQQRQKTVTSISRQFS